MPSAVCTASLSSDKRGFKYFVNLYLGFLAQPTKTSGSCYECIKENKQYIVSMKRRGFCIEEVHKASFIIQRRRSDMSGGRICLHYASVASALHHPPGWFIFKSLIRSQSVAFWLWLISASDKSLFLSPSSFSLSRTV